MFVTSSGYYSFLFCLFVHGVDDIHDHSGRNLRVLLNTDDGIVELRHVFGSELVEARPSLALALQYP